MSNVFNAIHQQLRLLLVNHFDLSELTLLCTDLAGNAEQVPGNNDTIELRAAQIINYFDKRGQLIDVIEWCDRRRSNIYRELREIAQNIGSLSASNMVFNSRGFWYSGKQISISYRCDVTYDCYLAYLLKQALHQSGYKITIITYSPEDEKNLKRIDQQIKASDVFIVIFSDTSRDSEVLKGEVEKGIEYQKLTGHPKILPIYSRFNVSLYSTPNYLSFLDYLSWNNSNDDKYIVDAVLSYIKGESHQLLQDFKLEHQKFLIEPVIEVSDDGRIINRNESIHRPLSKFDFRLVRSLETPGGVVKLRDTFYVYREADLDFKYEIIKRGTTTIIRAPRQTGKSSLLVRGMQFAQERGMKTLLWDFQMIDKKQLLSLEGLLRSLAQLIAEELQMDLNLDKIWNRNETPQVQLTKLISNFILPKIDRPILLALDEADKLLGVSYSSDFFGLIRSWHNLRAKSQQWNKLNLALVISTEPYLLIRNATQSPFNVGATIRLNDFSEVQIRDLNMQHGNPLKDDDIKSFIEIIGGQPYLCRTALYTMITKSMTWRDLQQIAHTDEGPFWDHLCHRYWQLLKDKPLRESLRRIIKSNQCDDETSFFRLLQAGLIKGIRKSCECRCGLYTTYFTNEL